jgi:hypothetical protein
MLHELIRRALEERDLRVGGCLEVHTGLDNEIVHWAITTPDAFTTEWGCALGRTCWPIGQFPSYRWLGWLHQDGGLLVRIED